MLIRNESADDCAAIRRVIEAAFGRPDEADLVDRLRADGYAVFSLVAEEQGGVFGHVMFSRMTAPFRALGLGPVAVSPEAQNAGIGRRLIGEGLRRARAEGWDGVFVLGEPRYYEPFGFRRSLTQDIDCAWAGPHFMALALHAGLPTLHGAIAYAPAFSALA